MKRCVSVLTFLFLVALVSADIIPQDPTPAYEPSSLNGNAFVGVTGFFPQWSRLGLQSDGSLNWITVTGCGFLTHSEVTCVFDFTFTSTYARIVDDGTIECELPTLDLTDFMTLPQYTRLDLVFEGDLVDYSVYVGQFRWGPELETDALSATRGPSNGGPAIQIFGQGFADPVLAALTFNVYFDGQLAQSASVSDDNTISVVPPAVDELGVDALVSIVWQGVFDNHGPVEVYLHSPVFFHYGPLFDSITPPCAWVNTSRSMTINGVGFTDPLFVNTVTSPDVGASARSNVMLEVSIAPNPTPLWDDDTYHSPNEKPLVLQAFSTSVSDTAVVFNSPNFLQGVINPSNVELGSFYGVVATVDVLWRQTRRLTSSDSALTYRYGPIFDGLDTEHWYYGGGDIVCLTGCGFLDPNVAAAINNDDLGIFAPGNALLWDQSFNPTVTDDSVCYPILDQVDCGSIAVTARLGTNSFFQNAALVTGVSIGTYFAGPELDLLFGGDAVQIPVAGGDVVLTGNHFGYSFSSRSSANDWPTITLATTSESGVSTNLIGGSQNLLGSHSVDIDLTSFSDTSLTLSWGVGSFGELFDLTITFDGACSIGAEVYMGPTCDSEAWFYSTLSGGTSVSISGVGFEAYTTTVKLCDHGSAVNNPPVSAAGGISTFGSTFPKCWEQQTIGEQVGTVEFYNETTGSSTISITTGGLFSFPDDFRGSRNWGQLFDVVVMFNSAQDGTFLDAFPAIASRTSWDVSYSACVDYDGTRQTGTDGTTPCSSYAALHCGTLRFGPVVDDFSPCQGPVGPVDTFITPVTFTGSFFDDSWAGVSRDINPHLVSFGNLFGQPITNPSASTMGTSTVWGGKSLSGTDSRNSITLFFDTCNITQVPNLKIHWGPWFDDCAMYPSFSDFPYPGTCDFYGAIPTEANLTNTIVDTISIKGYNLYEWNGDISCLIDGVESDDTTVTIDPSTLIGNVTCNVPRRPFGTRAKICLAFGTWSEESYDKHASPVSEWNDNDYRGITRVVCLDQVLVFAPALVGIDSELYAGHTSGLSTANTQESFDIDCYGCDNYWLSDFGPTYLVGSYATTADWANPPSIGYGTLTFDVPTFVAEFNTDVSIAIEWFQPYIDYPEFFKIWAEQTYHYGPLCDGGLSQTTAFLLGTTNGNPTSNQAIIDVSGHFFRDCLTVLTSQFCNNDTLNGACEIPQPSDTAQYPFTINGEGNRFCLHRAVEITMVGSPDSYANVEEESDTLDSVNSDTSLSIVLPNRTTIDCASYTFELFFPDALVTSASQRTIQCEGTLVYGPGRPTITGYYSYTTETDVLGLRTIYGWGGPRQIVSSSNDDSFVTAAYAINDPYWGSFSRLDVFFGSNSNVVQGDTFDGNTDYDVPVNSWGASVQLSTAYFDGATYKCRFNNAMFHYGSEILFSDRDDCAPSDVACTNLANPGNAVISGRALGCCGFSDSNSVSDTTPFQHRCAWSGTGATLWTSTTYLPTAISICQTSCSTLETVTCRIPQAEQDEAAAYRLVGFGLLLGSGTSISNGVLTQATACAGSNNVCSLPSAFLPYNQFDNDALQSDANRMQVCFGPKVYSDTYHTRLSGYAPRVGVSTVNPDLIDEFGIQVAGECNTAQVNTIGSINNVFLECNYDGDDGTETTYATSKWDCPARFMAKLCGATDDTLTVTFVNLTSPVSGFTYSYTPSEYIPTGNERGDWFIENGPVVVAGTIGYGPFVPFDGYTADADNTNAWLGYFVDNYTLPVPVNPDYASANPFLTIEINYADDWIAPTSTNTPVASSPITMWGTEKAACFFGTLDNTNPAYLLGLGNPDAQNDVATINDLGRQSDNVRTIDCYIPPGEFGAEGNVYVLLDPHTDDWTQFYNADDNLYSVDRAGDWHWTPYISSASSVWTAPEGLEPVTFYGYGFGDYLSVICQFGTELAVQGDIVSDSIVICQTPPYAAPATADVVLTFGVASDDSYDDNGCGYYSDTNPLFNSCLEPTTATFSSYSFTGVVSHNPRHGPVQGNTTIFFQQVGFDFYDSIDCVFHLVSGDSTVAASAAADASGDYSCITPNVDAPQEIQITLIGHYSTFENSTVYSTNLGCVWFAYGNPIITSISPDSVVFGSDVTQITLKGWYFNGGTSAANYQCVWQHGPIPDSDLPLELGATPTFNSDVIYTSQATLVPTTNTRDGLVFDTFDVVCSTPAGGFPQTGQYPFELIFSDLPTDNTFNFAVTYQTLVLSAVSPNSLKDFNATTVLTITGSGFAGGRQASDVHSNNYLCRTTLQNGFVVISPADFISDTEIQCYAASANLTAEFNQYVKDNRKACTGKKANINCNPTFDFPLDVSIDGGYTWTTQSLTITYSHQKLCKSSPASLLSPSIFSLLFVPFFFLVAYFF